jgi:hypothetical protein
MKRGAAVRILPRRQRILFLTSNHRKNDAFQAKEVTATTSITFLWSRRPVTDGYSVAGRIASLLIPPDGIDISLC